MIKLVKLHFEYTHLYIKKRYFYKTCRNNRAQHENQQLYQ